VLSVSQSIKALQKELRAEQAAEKRRREIARNPKYNRIREQFPDAGPFRRELYPKQMLFFRSGAEYTERCFMAANRVGKTRAGACELTYHLTGKYPPWWEGRRFHHPIEAWAAGSTLETTRDIVQAELLGKLGPGSYTSPGESIGRGTGMLPLACIRKVQPRSGGVADAMDQVYVRHVSGGTSVLGFKSYEQGRTSFEGTGKHVIWVDEECPLDVYLECLTRLLTTAGIIYLTFTPLQGVTDLVLRFLPAVSLD
jgi:phage terminase large subunit-like protein